LSLRSSLCRLYAVLLVYPVLRPLDCHPRYLFFPLSPPPFLSLFFFFNDTATTEIYTLSLHDALPIWADCSPPVDWTTGPWCPGRSEEHTSELQSRFDLVCRLLLEKKKKKTNERCGSRK